MGITIFSALIIRFSSNNKSKYRKRIVFIFLLLSTSVSAIDNPIDIIPRWQEIIESEPRTPVTAIFQIRNNSTERLILTSTLNLPNGWKQLIQDAPLVFEPDQSGIKILTFFIPQEAEVGLYKIEYIVKEEGIEEPTGLFRFDVRVLPSIRFELKLKRAPPYKIAGEEIEAVFVIQNNSNTDLFMDLDITSAYDFDYEIVDLPEKKLHLDIGESKEIILIKQWA